MVRETFGDKHGWFRRLLVGGISAVLTLCVRSIREEIEWRDEWNFRLDESNILQQGSGENFILSDIRVHANPIQLITHLLDCSPYDRVD